MTKLNFIIPKKSPMRFDVMLGDMFYTTLSLDVSVGVKYTTTELKTFARYKLPSLENRDFDLMPCGKPKFREDGRF